MYTVNYQIMQLGHVSVAQSSLSWYIIWWSFRWWWKWFSLSSKKIQKSSCPGDTLKNFYSSLKLENGKYGADLAGICKKKVVQAKWIRSPYWNRLLLKPTKTIQLFLDPVKLSKIFYFKVYLKAHQNTDTAHYCIHWKRINC